jgi:hypothetical protein
MLEKFLDACTELGNQARGVSRAGNGIDTEETKNEFVEFFGGKINDVLELFEKIKMKKS